MRRLLAALAAAVLLSTIAALGGQAAPDAAALQWSPGSVTLGNVGSSATVDLWLNSAQNLGGYELDLSFNPAVIAIDRVDQLASTPGRTWASLPASGDPNVTFVTLQPGVISFGAYSYGTQTQGSTGNVPIARVTLHAVGAGATSLHVSRALAAGADAATASPTLADAPVTVGPAVSVTGRVTLPSRTDYSGTQVATDNGSTLTAADGSFTLSTTAGQHRLTASRSGHLSRYIDVTVGSSGLALPSATVLLAGDANNDGSVDLFDLTLIAGQYGQNVPPGNPAADLNGDNKVDLTDLVLVAANYGRQGPVPWTAALAASGKAALDAPERLARRGPSLSVVAPQSVAAGEVFEAQVRVTGARDLAGADLALAFDPSAVEALSVEAPSQDAGPFFDPARVLVARSDIDAASGAAHYAAVQVGADAAAARQGALVTARFRALRDGAPTIGIAAARLVNRDGEDLTAKTAR